MATTRKVVVINPIAHKTSDTIQTEFKKKRVCAYARVSTDQEDQIHSYHAQIHEYTKSINENPDWEFQGMYADEGLSGTSTKKRLQFLKMIEDAKAGKIDLILTKSISRFARNTVDSLTIIRELRNNGVEVFFEKENISSSDSKIDFMLTIFSSIAQEESRNISENIKWGYRKRFKQGKAIVNTSRLLGYDKDENGQLVINPKQAETVKMIFNLFVSGISLNAISKHLIENEIPNGTGVVKWAPPNIKIILSNEKYAGDVILQKTVTIDYLSQRSTKNTGQAPMYHIIDNHEPIIPKPMFMLVQNMLKELTNCSDTSRYGHRFPLSGMVYCPWCLHKMNRRHYAIKNTTRKIVLSCKAGYRTTNPCKHDPIDTDALEQVSSEVLRTLNIKHPQVMKQVIQHLTPNMDTEGITNTINHYSDLIELAESDLRDILELRGVQGTSSDDFHFRKLYDNKKMRLLELREKRKELETRLVGNHTNESRLRQLIAFLEDKDYALSQEILESVIKKIIVVSPTEVVLIKSNTQLHEGFESMIASLIKAAPAYVGKTIYGRETIYWRVVEVELAS